MFTACWRSISALLVLLALALTGCPATSAPQGEKPGGASSGGTKRLMFVTNGDDPFWDALLSGLKEGATQHKLAEAGLSVHRDVNNLSLIHI